MRDKELYALVESALWSVHGAIFCECNGEKKLTHEYLNNLYGLDLRQFLADAKIEFHKTASLETALATPDCAEVLYVVELKINYPENKKERQNITHFIQKLFYYMYHLSHTTRKRICHVKKNFEKSFSWSDRRKRFFCHYRCLDFE